VPVADAVGGAVAVPVADPVGVGVMVHVGVLIDGVGMSGGRVGNGRVGGRVGKDGSVA